MGKNPAGEQETGNGTGVYEFLTGFITENGYAPSIKEIAAGTGIWSASTVHYYLKLLEKTERLKSGRIHPGE